MLSSNRSLAGVVATAKHEVDVAEWAARVNRVNASLALAALLLEAFPGIILLLRG